MAVLVSGATGCASTRESAARQDVSAARQARADAPSADSPSTNPENSAAPPPEQVGQRAAVLPSTASGEQVTRPAGSSALADYIRLALRHHPDVEASFERWQASVHRISRARRLPEPTIGFGYFLQSVETRVGPQRARLSLQQAFPWPTRLSAGADAGTAHARALQRQFDARALAVAEQVSLAYWNLWQVRSVAAIHREHLDVMQGLSDSVGARLATGAAGLAELQQVDLTVARIADNLRAMEELERAAEARLRAAIGQAVSGPLQTPVEPAAAVLPEDSLDELTVASEQHPTIESRKWSAAAAESQARVEKAERLPSFTVGADWIITGEAAMPDVEGSGRDAVIVGAGLRLPLWQGSYSEAIAAANAEARANRAEEQSLTQRARAEVAATYARLRDAARRVQFYRGTLVPQAETAYQSVLGSYTVGRGTVAQTLLSQRDLLELRIELEQARADHARAWSRLEELVARPLRPGAAPRIEALEGAGESG